MDAQKIHRPHADLTRLNEVSERVIGCAIEVHRTLGTGLLERIYEDALVHELSTAGLRVDRQVPIRVAYKGTLLSELRIDLLVERSIIVEVKAVTKVADEYLAQLVSYLRATDMPLGLLINFHARRVVDGVYRRINSSSSLTSAISASSAFNSAC